MLLALATSCYYSIRGGQGTSIIFLLSTLLLLFLSLSLLLTLALFALLKALAFLLGASLTLPALLIPLLVFSSLLGVLAINIVG
jgi:hypothetical protein